jgi:hypothetical protein
MVLKNPSGYFRSRSAVEGRYLTAGFPHCGPPPRRERPSAANGTGALGDSRADTLGHWQLRPWWRMMVSIAMRGLRTTALSVSGDAGLAEETPSGSGIAVTRHFIAEGIPQAP